MLTPLSDFDQLAMGQQPILGMSDRHLTFLEEGSMRPLCTMLATCILAVLLSGSLEAATIQSRERDPAPVAPGSDPAAEGDLAVGSAEDTLGACMARIPKDASIGQLMIAEQSCWRDENERKPIQAVPGARRTGLLGPGSVAMGHTSSH